MEIDGVVPDPAFRKARGDMTVPMQEFPQRKTASRRVAARFTAKKFRRTNALRRSFLTMAFKRRSVFWRATVLAQI
jgi:hypothetical protein